MVNWAKKEDWNKIRVEMVKTFFEDAPEELKRKIANQCSWNAFYGGDWLLPEITVYDVQGKSSKDSGWYVALSGTRSGLKFFVNNENEFIRKPRNSIIKYEYSVNDYYGIIDWDKLFWNYSHNVK